MQKSMLKLVAVAAITALLFSAAGCASLKKKLTRKKKKKPEKVYFQVRKYAVLPSMELYEKHYTFWVNWHRKLVAELGGNFKSDIRSTEEMRGNLEAMESLLTDEKAAELAPHVAELKKIETVIKKRNMTKANDTRIRRILEREYRFIRSHFSPTNVKGAIRAEWKKSK